MHATPGRSRPLTIDPAPTIAGLRFRTFAGPTDIAALARLYQAADAADHAPGFRSTDRVALELETWSHLDPSEDLVVATVGDAVVGAVENEWSDTTDGDRHYRALGAVYPAWRRRGLGDALMSWSERRRIDISRTHEVAGEKVLTTWFQEADRGGLELAVAHGYLRTRTYSQMVRADLDDVALPPLSPGLEVRAVTETQLADVFAGMSEAFRDHFGGHDDTPDAFRRWSGDPDFDADLLVIAFDGDEVAAGVCCRIDPTENEARGYQRGWTDPIFTRRPWRRRGLASALLGRALVRLREAGMTSAQLDVDTQNANAALKLYERHGFVEDDLLSEWHRTISV